MTSRLHLPGSRCTCAFRAQRGTDSGQAPAEPPTSPFRTPALPAVQGSCCVPLGESPNLSVPQLLLHQRGSMQATTCCFGMGPGWAVLGKPGPELLLFRSGSGHIACAVLTVATGACPTRAASGRLSGELGLESPVPVSIFVGGHRRELSGCGIPVGVTVSRALGPPTGWRGISHPQHGLLGLGLPCGSSLCVAPASGGAPTLSRAEVKLLSLCPHMDLMCGSSL